MNDQNNNQNNSNNSSTLQLTPVKGVHRKDFYQQPSTFAQGIDKDSKRYSNDEETISDWQVVDNNESDSPNSQNERLFIKSNHDLSQPIQKPMRKDFKIKSVNSSTACTSNKQSIKEMNEKLQDILMINPKERTNRQPSKSIKQPR